jgi:MFS transporter, DHA1 family, multidrug resistance protein
MSFNINVVLSLLCFMLFISMIGFGIVLPILPFIASDFGSNDFVYGLLIAVFPLFQFVFAPIWGNLSDKFGRRPILNIGLFGSAFSFALFGLANNLEMLFFSRILAGIFTSASLPTANAYIADCFPGEKRGVAFGYLGASQALGFAVGPAIGGFLAEVPFYEFAPHYLPSMFAAVLAAAALILTLFFVPESLSKNQRSLNFLESQEPTYQKSSIKVILRNPNLIILILFFGIIGYGMSSFITVIGPFAPRVYGIGPKEVGYLFSVGGMVFALTQGTLIKPLSRRFNDASLIKIGFAFSSIGFGLIILFTDFYLSFLATIPLFFGLALVNPVVNSLISKNSPPSQQGSIMGINQGFNAMTRVIGPVTAGFFLMLGDFLSFKVNFVLFTITTLVAIAIFRSENQIVNTNNSILETAMVVKER